MFRLISLSKGEFPLCGSHKNVHQLLAKIADTLIEARFFDKKNQHLVKQLLSAFHRPNLSDAKVK